MKHTRMKLKTAVKNLHEGWKFRQARLTNWYPATELKYKHTSAFWMEPYVSSAMTPEKYYPN